MTTTTHHAPVQLSDRAAAEESAARLVQFLETGQVADGLFAEDVFLDYMPPQWRVQAKGRENAVALRRNGHPSTGRVPRTRLDVTESGFVLEVDEEWEQGGQTWTAHELIRCDLGPAGITEISVFCTGDWDEAAVAGHAAAVDLLRP